VDLSGQSAAAVDIDGWTYAVDFPWLKMPPLPGMGRKYVWLLLLTRSLISICVLLSGRYQKLPTSQQDAMLSLPLGQLRGSQHGVAMNSKGLCPCMIVKFGSVQAGPSRTSCDGDVGSGRACRSTRMQHGRQHSWKRQLSWLMGSRCTVSIRGWW